MNGKHGRLVDNKDVAVLINHIGHQLARNACRLIVGNVDRDGISGLQLVNRPCMNAVNQKPVFDSFQRADKL